MSPFPSFRSRTKRLLATSAIALAGTSAAVALPATAHANAAGTYEINQWRHFAGLTQEVGSDEFFLATVNFKVQLGVTGTANAWANPTTVIDDIDDEEYHSVPASMGQSLFPIGGWTPFNLIFNQGPWIYGSVTQMFEADTNNAATRNRLLNALAASVKVKLQQYAENATPAVVGLNAITQWGIDLVDPKNAALRDAAFRDWIVGAGVTTVVKTITDGGIWNTVKTALTDDPIGAPQYSIVVGLDGALGTLFNNYTSTMRPAVGNHVSALPETLTSAQRNYKQQYKGDGARYVMDVRQGRL